MLNNEIKEQTKSNRKYMNCCNSKKLEQKIKCKMNKTRQEECVNKPYINIKRYLTTHTHTHTHTYTVNKMENAIQINKMEI